MSDAVCPYVLDPEGADTHGETARLRAQGAIARVELQDGVLAWSVHDYQVAKQIMGDDQRFPKNPRRNWPAYINGEISNGWPLITWVAMDTMATQDGADHRRLRKLLLKAFTARRVESMKPHIEKTVNELLDNMSAAPGPTVDMKAMFHSELPTRLMCDLFGVPEERRDEVLEGGHKNIDTRISPEAAEANLNQWQEAISDLVAYKRENPGDDLTTGLIAARDEGDDKLTDSELIGTLHLLLGAGSETLVNALAHASVALLADPDLKEKVIGGEIPWEEIFEETLRVESPVAHLPFRYATEDVEIGGVKIAKGDAILVDFAGIGRDPSIHGETSDEFDACRADKTHLSFGHGVHYCLGAQLAKQAWMIGIPALFDRFPDLTLAVSKDELVGQGSFVVNGHAELPVYLKGEPTSLA